MLNNKSYICWIITTLVLVSCEKGIGTSMLWGKTDYYTDFMFYEYEPVRMTRTICFDANEDSEGRVGNVKFSLYKMSNDSTYVPVKDDILLYKNENLCSDNILEITPHDKEIRLGIEFTPTAKEGTHKWFLKVLDNGGFDRINDYSTEDEALPLLLEWKAEKNNVSNPLALGLGWLFFILLGLLLIWLFIMKPIMYPTFKVGNIQIISGSYYSTKKINKARKLVVTSSPKRQSSVNKFFTGKIIYERNEMWKDEWELHPKGKGARLVGNRKYTINPFAVSLEKHNEYQLEHLESDTKAKITLL